MRIIKLVTDPFEFISLLEVKCTKELNRHAEILITGLIRNENGDRYLKKALMETWIDIKGASEDGEERQIFSGILTGFKIKQEGETKILTIEAKTGSFLLDIKPHIRSFQEPSLLYSDVVRACVESVNGKFIMLDKEKEQIRQFLLQYNETDWCFLNRLATYAGTVLIPEYNTKGKKFYFGYRLGPTEEIVDCDKYEIEQDYGRCENRKAEQISNFSMLDAIKYKIYTREIYDLGRTVKFKGREFIIKKINSYLVGHELYNEYQLSTKIGGVYPPIYNQGLTGVSLKAYVTNVEKANVMIEIQEDENKENCGRRWFEYATVYSTPDGTGWYCMPEIGDEVRLMIPRREEACAYVESSIHMGENGGRIKPENKSWKNKQNKEILMTPDSIVLQNNKGLKVELLDTKVIILNSNKYIIIESTGEVLVKSKKSGIEILAKDEIIMRQKECRIRMNDVVDISGGKIYMN